MRPPGIRLIRRTFFISKFLLKIKNTFRCCFIVVNYSPLHELILNKIKAKFTLHDYCYFNIFSTLYQCGNADSENENKSFGDLDFHFPRLWSFGEISNSARRELKIKNQNTLSRASDLFLFL